MQVKNVSEIRPNQDEPLKEEEDEEFPQMDHSSALNKELKEVEEKLSKT